MTLSRICVGSRFYNPSRFATDFDIPAIVCVNPSCYLYLKSCFIRVKTFSVNWDAKNSVTFVCRECPTLFGIYRSVFRRREAFWMSECSV